MAIIKLTKRAIEKLLAPDPSGKQVLHWDSELKGFGVLCSGKTAVKTYIVQRKLPGGLTRRVTVGAFNAMDLDAARQRATEILGDFYKGRDPKAERREAARRGKVLQAALDEYLASRKDLSPKSQSGYRAAIERHLADWADRPLREITADMVEQRHTEVAAEVKARAGDGARRGGGPTNGAATANGVMRALRAIWYFAAERDPGAPSKPGAPAKARLVRGAAARAAGARR